MELVRLSDNGEMRVYEFYRFAERRHLTYPVCSEWKETSKQIFPRILEFSTTSQFPIVGGTVSQGAEVANGREERRKLSVLMRM